MTQEEKEWEKDFMELAPTQGELDSLQHHPFMCQKELHPGELCGCAVALWNNKIKDFITQLRTDTIRQTIEECIEATKLDKYNPITGTVTSPDGDKPTTQQWENKGFNEGLFAVRRALQQKLTSNE